MTTTATEHSPATARKAKAETDLRQLKGEREQILNRQQTARAAIERLNEGIVQAQRTGEADTLTSLRANRREAEESIQDLERTLPAVVNDLRLAEGELVMSERACCAERWNKIQTEQAQLLKTIEESINMIADAIADKERLAHRQKILGTVLPGADRNPDLLRPDLAHAITARLQGNPPNALRTIDWTCLRMSEQGELS